MLLTGCAHEPFYDATKPVSIQSADVGEAESGIRGQVGADGAIHGGDGHAAQRTEKIAVIGSPRGPIIVRGNKQVPQADPTKQSVFPQLRAPSAPAFRPPTPACTKDQHVCPDKTKCKVGFKIKWFQPGHRLPGDDIQPHEVPDRRYTNHEAELDLRSITGFHYRKDKGSDVSGSRTWGPYGPDDRFNAHNRDEEVVNFTRQPQNGYGYGSGYTSYTAPSYGGSSYYSAGSGVPVYSYTTSR